MLLTDPAPTGLRETTRARGGDSAGASPHAPGRAGLHNGLAATAPSAHIGPVFNLYEIDVRQFLNKSSFTQSGMRHVLNSALRGLRLIHDRGSIRCDLKPAHIFMRWGDPFARLL